MRLSPFTAELFYWLEEAQSEAAIGRTYACVPGFQTMALTAAYACRNAIARMAGLLKRTMA